MLKKLFKKTRVYDLGLDRKPGDDHYRAYVGPPKDYDFVSAMVFNLLTCIGLRQDHKVLDIGCGSLRNGRLLIPYLNRERYIGVDPNKWLIDDGIENEVGEDLVKIKKPVFSYADSLKDFKEPLGLDYAFAQSVFSHTGLGLLEQWLSEVSYHLKKDGVLLATFLGDDEDSQEIGWVYPGCVKFNPDTVCQIASKHGLHFQLLNWFHPRQSWAAFYKDDYDTKLIKDNDISWNRCCENN